MSRYYSWDVPRPHFSHLKELDPGVGRSVTSSFVQEVLSSCPHLEYFRAPWIDADDVANGKPWICIRLKELNLRLRFKLPAGRSHQPLVFDQLSRRTRLEVLLMDETLYNIDSLNRYGEPPVYRVGSDLRLEKALGKLSGLRRLREISFKNMNQRMREQEIDWIMEN